MKRLRHVDTAAIALRSIDVQNFAKTLSFAFRQSSIVSSALSSQLRSALSSQLLSAALSCSQPFSALGSELSASALRHVSISGTGSASVPVTS